jgi:hypothetical protein
VRSTGCKSPFCGFAAQKYSTKKPTYNLRLSLTLGIKSSVSQNIFLFLDIQMPILVCKKVIFYSQADESAFFHFVREIKSIKKFSGVGDEIHLDVSSRLSNESLRALLSLFYRYKIEMGQLRHFEKSQNTEWFRNQKMYWYKKVFGGENQL